MVFKVSVNEKSVSGKLKALEALSEEKVKDKLKLIADDLVVFSPVDTGAYVLSHTFAATGSGAGRRYSSHGKPRNQDAASKQAEAKAQLYAEIEAAPISSTRAGIFRNRAPHATAVETKHSVYTKTKDRAR